MNEEVIKKALTRVKISNIVWLCLSIFMILCGIPMIFGAGYGLGMIALAVWNLIQVSTMFKNIKEFEANPSLMVYYYKDRNYVVQFILNFLFGAVIGVVATIFEAFTQKYIMDHGDDLLNYRILADEEYYYVDKPDDL